jgi:hypothetical protein
VYYEQCKRRKRGPNIGEVNPLENALERDVGLYHKYREATPQFFDGDDDVFFW